MINSGVNPTMVASKTFDSILEQIQASNLNFQLQISPFSANISLKRSPIKDKFGSPIFLPNVSQTCLPNSSEVAVLVSKNLKLESDLEALKKNYEFAVQDSVEAHQKIRFLESQHVVKVEPNETLERELSEQNYLVKSLSVKIEKISNENEHCQRRIEQLSLDNKDLEKAKKKSDEISNIFKKQLSDAQVKFKKEKDELLKEHRKEVKAWRKDLGDETKLKIKLQEKLSKTTDNTSGQPTLVLKPVPQSEPNVEISEDTLCSICAVPIINYVQKYFEGEPFSPACDQCDDNSWTTKDEAKTVAEENDIEKLFENFLSNFRGEDSSPKYEALALELVKTQEITLDVSIADIRTHNQALMTHINAVEYKEAFQFLCSTLLKFVKARNSEISVEKLFVKLVP